MFQNVICFSPCFSSGTLGKSIATIAAGYEVIEWLYAALANPEAGIAYLGSQGDMWGAQKDMLADTLGAVAVMALFRMRL